MDLQQMYLFACVVEAKTITAAARKLAMPKSTLSRRLSELEGRLGVTLLRRTTRGLSLTEVGREYFERCRSIVQEAELADRAVADQRGSPHGTLRITAPLAFADAFLGPVAAAYLQRYPEVQLDASLADAHVDLVAGRFDLAVRIGRLSDSSLVTKRIGPARTVCCASPGYLELRGVPEHPRELSEHTLIALRAAEGASPSWRFVRGQESMTVAAAGRLRANSIPIVRDAVIAGLGITVLPRFALSSAFEAGELVTVLPGWRTDAGAIHVVFPTGHRVPAKARAFADLLAEVFANIEPPVTDRD